MAKRRTKATTKRKSNPLVRRIARPPRPKLSFDGSRINSSFYSGTPVTVATIASGYFTVDCNFDSTTGQAGVAPSVAAVTGLYDTYRIEKCSLEFIPSIGPAGADAAGRIHLAYIDNAEKMALFAAATSATRLNMVRGTRNVFTFNFWERVTWNVPLTWRRKVFDVNSTIVAGADVLDRSTQGYVIYFIESVSAAIVAGTFRIQTNTMVHGLDLGIAT